MPSYSFRASRYAARATSKGDHVFESVEEARRPVLALSGGLPHLSLASTQVYRQHTHWSRAFSSAGMPSGRTGRARGLASERSRSRLRGGLGLHSWAELDIVFSVPSVRAAPPDSGPGARL